MIAKAVGTIDGDVIRLDQPLGLPHASRVELTIAPLDVLTADGTNSWTIWNGSVMNSRSVLVEDAIREMSFMNAVDTNVLLYAVDEDEPAKRKRAREFLRQLGRTDEPLLMWQVLGEFLAGLRRWEQHAATIRVARVVTSS